MYVPHQPHPEGRRELTNAIRESLADDSVDLPYGSQLPRVGFLPHDDEGILMDIFCEMTDAGPVSNLIAEPLINEAHNILEGLDEGIYTEAVARSMHREWTAKIEEWLWGMTPEHKKFDALVDHSVCEWLWDTVYSMDGGGAWMYIRSKRFDHVVAELPVEKTIDEIAAIVAVLEPDAFICVWDYDGVYIYCSPNIQNCGETKNHTDCVGGVNTDGPHPTYVLPKDILKGALEIADAAGLLHDR